MGINNKIFFLRINMPFEMSILKISIYQTFSPLAHEKIIRNNQ